MNQLMNPDGSPMDTTPKIDPRTLPWIGCEKGTQIYEQGYLFKKVSALISPTGREENAPIEVVTCKGCGKVPKFVWSQIPDFPEELKSECK